MSCGKPSLSVNVLWICTSFYFSLLEKRKEINAKGKKKNAWKIPGNTQVCLAVFSGLYLINTRTLRYVFWILFLDPQSQWSKDFGISRTFLLLKMHCENLSCNWNFALVTTDFLVMQLNADHIWTANKKFFCPQDTPGPSSCNDLCPSPSGDQRCVKLVVAPWEAWRDTRLGCQQKQQLCPLRYNEYHSVITILLFFLLACGLWQDHLLGSHQKKQLQRQIVWDDIRILTFLYNNSKPVTATLPDATRGMWTKFWGSFGARKQLWLLPIYFSLALKSWRSQVLEGPQQVCKSQRSVPS